MDRHTIIIAQSGSGKSFFLGKLIEEIMIKTKSRCLILDPNGDFRKINKIDDAFIINYALEQQAATFYNVDFTLKKQTAVILCKSLRGKGGQDAQN